MDRLIGLVGEAFGNARPTYNKNHIALGTSGRNFCWFHPPKTASHCHVRVRVPAEASDEEVEAIRLALQEEISRLETEAESMLGFAVKSD